VAAVQAAGAAMAAARNPADPVASDSIASDSTVEASA
jgi:hypothetical protein